MSPLFMDTGYGPNSPGSLSAEECNSNTAGSEREGEGHQVGRTGKKRREKNRDAARRTRQKQTERADQLHEELQSLERTNSALQKEITLLKKDLHRYTTALAHHEPYCCLKTSGSSSSSTSHLSVSPSAESQAISSSPKVTPQTSSSTLATGAATSTSSTTRNGRKTHDRVENTHISPSVSALKAATLALSPGSSAELVFSSSSPVTVPYSLSFSTLSAPHSLFCKEPPITSTPMNITPVSASLVSSCHPSSLTTAAQTQSGQDTVHQMSSASANPPFSTHSNILDVFLMKQTSFVSVSSNVVPHNERLLEQGYPLNVPQIHEGQYSGDTNGSSSLSPLVPLTLQDPALRSLPDSPQANLEPSPVSGFALKPNYSLQMTPHHASLLSLLTVPSPLNISASTSNSSDGFVCQSAPSLPPLGDSISDFSLSELLEVDDWILNGASDQ